MSADLQSALFKERPRQLPPSLPLGHVSAFSSLADILGAGELRPRRCHVFGRDLLYFSYGGLFYRPDRAQTESATLLPVGLVLSPVSLKSIDSLYPFDSGAMAKLEAFSDWRGRMAPFETRFHVRSGTPDRDAATLVKLLYKTNKRYLDGVVSGDAGSRTDPFPLLAAFLADNMTPLVDHRQRSIECLTERTIQLRRSLVWIGIPLFNTASTVRKIYQCTSPERPIVRRYRYHCNFSPAGLAEKLEELAYEDVIKRYVEPL